MLLTEPLKRRHRGGITNAATMRARGCGNQDNRSYRSPQPRSSVVLQRAGDKAQQSTFVFSQQHGISRFASAGIVYPGRVQLVRLGAADERIGMKAIEQIGSAGQRGRLVCIGGSGQSNLELFSSRELLVPVEIESKSEQPIYGNEADIFQHMETGKI